MNNNLQVAPPEAGVDEENQLLFVIDCQYSNKKLSQKANSLPKVYKLQLSQI